MSTTEQVRPIIECFCQILSLYGFSTITSDSFYLAKFDQNEATIPLWKLIFEMIHFHSNINKQQLLRNQFDQIPKDEMVNMLKTNLYQRGYTYDYFLSLDNNMEKGSSQLLVCVGWLICHLKFIDKCLKSILKLDQNQNDLITQVKQSMHSNSKIRSRLQYIHENVNNSEDHHMSAFETQLYQNPHLISEYLTELETEHYKLSLFLFWNKHENTFWKWMESVLDQPSSAIETNCQNLEAEKQKFNAAIDTLDSALVRLEQLWISNSDHRSIEHEVSLIISSIDTQISSLFNQLLNPNPLLSIKSL